jgi:NAD(P)-dependent dehydrogenase (short-subunit alcohol dehydrogenase family)
MPDKRFDVQALFDVRGRTAVITGGSGHFGRAMASALTQAGVRGYADYREIDPKAWMGREQEGILFVPHAGEMLYRARGI